MKPILPSVKPYIKALIPYPPGKPIDELTREYGIREPIKLASNENPLGPAPGAVAAILEALRNLHRYPDGSGYYLKSALSLKYKIPPEGIFLGNGSNEIIELALKTFITPGDEVLSPFPSFLMYSKIVQALGGKNKFVPLKRFRIDLEGLLEGLGPRSRVIIVNNPNNPTGTIVRKKEWERFLDLVPARVLVILDEAYIDFSDDPECPLGTDYLAGDKNLLVIRTFSKAYGLAGLRVGYGLSRPELTDLMNRVRQPFNVNSLAQAGALGALQDKAFYKKTIRIVQQGKAFLEQNFKNLGLRYIPSHANFILIQVPLPAQELYERMLHKGVIIRSMKSFGLEQFIRINVGLPAENRRFLQVLRQELNL